MRNKLLLGLRPHVQPGEALVAAVSGGKDSMALLHGLKVLSSELGFTLSAAHFDHRLRGAESRRDAEFVENICREWDIPCHVGSGDVAQYAKSHGLGTEEAARLLRYEFFASLPAQWIVTAHTAEDNLETLLMHLLRGTGLHGLTGIPPVRGKLLRPMLAVTAEEISDYLEKKQIPHVEDSSNAGDAYLRNRLRHQVLPLLQAENPQVVSASVGLLASLRQEDAYLLEAAEAALSGIRDGDKLSCSGLLALPEALQMRCLMGYLSPAGSLGRIHYEAARTLIAGDNPSARLTLPGGWQLIREYDRAVLRQEDSFFCPEQVKITPGETVQFGAWKVSCALVTAPAKFEKGYIYLAPPENAPLNLRVRKPGDRIRLPGGTKKLGRYLMDVKFPAALRDFLPLVCCGDTVLAVLPLTAGANYRPDPGQLCLRFSAERMEEVT